MTRKQIKILTPTLIGIIVLTNLTFLPGPKILYNPSQIFYYGGQLLGSLGLILVPIGLIWASKQIIQEEDKLTLAPILLWTIPISLFISTFVIANFTRNFSRNFAIKQADKILMKIDAFNKAKGYYPESLLQAEINTPSFGIIGIDDYYYSKDENSYELCFYQNVLIILNYEIVTYNSAGNHSAKGEQKELFETKFDKWKYEIFD